MWTSIRPGVVAPLVALLFAIGACGGSGGIAAPSTSASTTSEEQIMAIAREYGTCMRANGVPGFRDMRLENHRLRGGGAPDGAADEATLRAATAACQAIYDRIPASAFTAVQPSAADLDRMRRFSECLRQHGIPEWPDPDGNGRFPAPQAVYEQAMKADAGVAARAACRQHYDGPIVSAGGGGSK